MPLNATAGLSTPPNTPVANVAGALGIVPFASTRAPRSSLLATLHAT